MRAVNEYKNDSEYVIFTYVKGSLMFNSAYEAMGAAKFWKALSSYFNEGQYTVATPSMLIDCFVGASSKEIGTIFNSFIDGTEVIGKVKN